MSEGAGTLYSVATALYRRYRPETFAELIGQAQVTDPLRTALRNDRVNHAYLFSGPRGCGKTTSARILARCLNCAEGPTDTPCGVCASCVELSRDGGGSLDVVEIDAASHNGVDDARDLRERAVFAPARDRYKIFILDEAHMVTPQGFNALLKIVEEPPEHVKFIFATTEPDKVIGTIRSRTHHYPFRLVPPAQMLEYVHQLSESEKVQVEPGVLSLVVRAGGGSVRDTLSLLDQLIAGSEGTNVQYERAVALLGYTHGALLSDVVDALGERDAASAFGAVDRVIQTGQDPRRFVEDLLERLRDLIIVSAYSRRPGQSASTDGAAAVLRGVQQEELEHMAQQAAMFGTAELSRAADTVNAALTDMTGATSPRLHLELMVARVLIPQSDDSTRGALARVERLERRVGVATTAEAVADARVTPGDASGTAAVLRPAPAGPGPAGSAVAPSLPVAPSLSVAPSAPAQSSAEPAALSAAPQASAPAGAAPVTLGQVKDAWPEILDAVQKAKRTAWMVVFNSHVLDLKGDVLYLSFVSENDVTNFKQQQGVGQGVSEFLRRAIVEVLGLRVKFVARVDAAAHAKTAQSAPTQSAPRQGAPGRGAPASAPRAPSQPADNFAPHASTMTWATVAVPDSASPISAPPAPGAGASALAAPASQPTAQVADAANSASAPATTPDRSGSARAIPVSVDGGPPDFEPVEEADREPEPEYEPDDSPIVGSTPPGRPATLARPPSPATPATSAKPPVGASRPTAPNPALDKQRYGESVVREILGASFIEEQAVAPRVTPRID